MLIFAASILSDMKSLASLFDKKYFLFMQDYVSLIMSI